MSVDTDHETAHRTAPGTLTLLACAVAGRQVDVAESRGDRAWSDGQSIFIPAGLALHEAVACVAAQATLLAQGSLTARAARPATSRAR